MKTKFTIDKTTYKIVSWIINSWFSSVENSGQHSVTWLNQVNGWIKANGTIWTINHIKMIRLIVLSYLSGNKLKSVNQIIGINKSNCLPKSITYLHKLIESGSRDELRFVLTLLSISRAIPGWKSPDLSTIENVTSPKDEVIDEIASSFDDFVQTYDMRMEFPSYLHVEENMLFSQKAGPNGPATRTSLLDLAIMPEELKAVLKSCNIKNLMEKYENLLTGQRVIRYHIVLKLWKEYSKQKLRLISWFDQFFHKPFTGYIRKLSVVQDPEAKSRIVAIFDYWSQTYLRQIHRIHFKYLKRIPYDFTFTQDPVILDKSPDQKYYSFDLTAATDQFPIKLQKKLIESMFGSAIAESWEYILISEPFYVPWEKRFIKYGSGQPMGAYSSWTTFTLTHHGILHHLSRKLNIEGCYKILGDDIVIYNDELAKEYQRIMEGLDVKISLQKSHISQNMYEFAKRIFLNGREITGIQLRGLIENHSKYHLIYQMVYELIFNRGYIPNKYTSIPDLFFKLFSTIKEHKKEALNLRSRVDLLHSFRRYIEGDMSHLISFLARRYPENPHSLFRFPEIEMNNLLYLSADRVIQRTTASYINYANDILKPLEIEKAAIGLSDQNDIWTSPIYYLTKLPIIESLANTISLLSRSLKNESVKDLVKSIAFPKDDIFDKRSTKTILNTQARMAKDFLAQFESVYIKEVQAFPTGTNLSKMVLSSMKNDLNTYKIERLHGLVPGDTKPKPVKIDLSTPMW